MNDMNWPEVIESAKSRFVEVAPKGMEFTAERAFAIQHLQNNDYLLKVAKGNPTSLQTAVFNVAAIGLSLNPAKKQAYLIPRTVKQGGNFVSKVFLEPSYVGLCDLATMTGSIKWVQANVVHEADEFIDNGPGNAPTHKYKAFAKDRGPIVGAYCVARTADGDHLTTVMDLEELEGIRDRSESYKAYKEGKVKSPGPWGTDFGEQCKKTVIRRAYKTWPKTESTDRLALAIDLSNQNEGFEPIVSAPPLGQFTADQKGLFDQMITQSDDVGMFLFTKSIDEAVFTSLYHSFEKGTKGKYQGIVDSLCQKGAARLRDVSDALADCCERGDDAGAVELLEGMSADAVEYMATHFLDHEPASYMRQILSEQAA